MIRPTKYQFLDALLRAVTFRSQPAPEVDGEGVSRLRTIGRTEAQRLREAERARQ